ncbi:hypothetical protein BGW38_006409, partial [Lunasporangiospora selenospora]
MGGDPKMRQIYDKYGTMGVQMAGTDVGSQLLEIEGFLLTIFILISIVCILVIIFFSFLSVRVDGKVTWDYRVVFIPLWIVDAVLFGVAIMATITPVDEESIERELDEENDETSSAAREERKTKLMRERRTSKLFRGIYMLVFVALLTAFQALIARRANDSDSISGPAVFAPYFALEGLLILGALLGFLGKVRQQQIPTAMSKIRVFFESIWWKVARLVLAILIMLRIDNNITCSWGVVFIPLYVVGLKYLLQIVFGYKTFSKSDNVEVKTQGQTLMVLLGVVF